MAIGSISGTDLPPNRAFGGPFEYSNGNLFVVVRNSTTHAILEVWKSTNGGSTWSYVANLAASNSLYTLIKQKERPPL